jgi:hypothetical protein
MKTTITESPRRRRAVATAEFLPEIPAELQEHAAVFYRQNQASNAAKRLADAARKALYAGMKDAGLDSFEFPANIDGRGLFLQAVLETPLSTVVDVARLRKEVSDEQFLQIVSASLKAVETVAGREVLTRCSSTVSGTENVKVGPKK